MPREYVVETIDVCLRSRGVSKPRMGRPLDELADLRSHAPLVGERHVRRAVADQALKQGHVELALLGEPVNGGAGPKLLVVPNEDDVARLRVQRAEDVRLEDLSRLLDDDYLRSQLLQKLLVLAHGRRRHSNDLVLTPMRMTW